MTAEKCDNTSENTREAMPNSPQKRSRLWISFVARQHRCMRAHAQTKWVWCFLVLVTIALTAPLLTILTDCYWQLGLHLSSTPIPRITPRIISIEPPHSDHRRQQNVCEAHKNVFLLKVAKAGSSTVQQLLFRFGMQRNLSFVLFYDTWTYPRESFVAEVLPASTRMTGRYNILAEHTRFNETDIRATMESNTFYLATIRSPLSHLNSMITYSNLFERLHLNGSDDDYLDEFLRNPDAHDRTGLVKDMQADFFAYSATTDRQFVDVDGKFPLVIVLDAFDESLILLRRRLCWSIKDILYLPLRSQHHKNHASERVTKKREHLLRQWSIADYRLYDHFLARTRKQIAAACIEKEVEYFREVLQRVTTFCKKIRTKMKPFRHNRMNRSTVNDLFSATIEIKASEFEPEFMVSGFDCALLMLNPEYYRFALTVRQLPELCQVKGKPFLNGRPHKVYIDPRQINRTNVGMIMLDTRFCGDYFAYTFPWEILKASPFNLIR